MHSPNPDVPGILLGLGDADSSEGEPSADDKPKKKKKGKGKHESDSSSSSKDSDDSDDEEPEIVVGKDDGAKKVGKNGGKADPVVADAVDPPSERKKTRRQLELEKLKIVVVDLPSLASTIDHPRHFLIAKASFETAVDSKLSTWERETIEGDVVSKADEFLQTIEPVKAEPDVVALNVNDIVGKAQKAAQALKAFRDVQKTWRLPLDVDAERTVFDELCRDYDEALGDLASYADTIHGFSLRRCVTDKKASDKAKTAVKLAKDMLFQQLVKTGVPKILAKVL